MCKLRCVYRYNISNKRIYISGEEKKPHTKRLSMQKTTRWFATNKIINTRSI